MVRAKWDCIVLASLLCVQIRFQSLAAETQGVFFLNSTVPLSCAGWGKRHCLDTQQTGIFQRGGGESFVLPCNLAACVPDLNSVGKPTRDWLLVLWLLWEVTIMSSQLALKRRPSRVL